MNERVAILYGGARGNPGGPGKPGDPGPRGPGFRAKGDWQEGATYSDGDAISAEGSAAPGIYSLFIQRDGTGESVSLLQPRKEPGRWQEVGPRDLSNVTGAVWRVYQLNHGFTRVGQPVGYSRSVDRWVLANNKMGEVPAVAVVREVISAHEVLLQGSGEISNLDPGVINPPAAEFAFGEFYYVDRVMGRLTRTPTVAAAGFAANAALVATGPASGVILQWQQTPNIVGYRPAGYVSFFFEAEANQVTFSGDDLTGRTLGYTVSDQTQVIVDGLVLDPLDGFTASNGTSFTLGLPALGGERVEIRVLAEPLQAIAPATALPIDNFGNEFDGETTVFAVTVGGGTSVAPGPSQNALIWLDGNAQEPYIDYELMPDAGSGTNIRFTEPPRAGTRFWGIVGVAVSNLNFLSVGTLVAEIANLQALAWETATGIAADITTLTGVGLTYTSGTFGALVATNATVTTLTITGTSTLAALNAAATTLASLTVTGNTTLAALSAQATTLASLTVTGQSTLAATQAASLTVSGAATLGSLTVNGASALQALTATTGTFTGTVEAPTLRAGVLRGPTAGGQVVVEDFTVDEGTF